MDSLKKQESYYRYEDKKTHSVYVFGLIEQIYGFPIFRKVEIDKKSQFVTIEGITTMSGSVADTTKDGFCPFSIIVATPDSNHFLYNVRFLTTTHCQDNDANSKDGFFSVKFQVNPGDILIIGNPGGAGSGAIVYNIYKLLNKE